MLEIKLKNFRGFHDQNWIRVNPITFLVGDNSAGKTSFMAAIYYILQFIKGQSPSFNTPPFQLGTFKQIAHFRGGRAGRAKEFEIHVRTSIKNKENMISLYFLEDAGFSDLYKIKINIEGMEVFADKKTGKSYIKEGGMSHAIDTFNINVPIANANTLYSLIFSEHFRIIEKSSDTTLFGLVLRMHNLGERVREVFNFFSDIIATSPIRTNPERTYTPGKNVSIHDGSYVPYELANIYRRNKEKWRKLKREIEVYGKDSGMFVEVNVKSFGKTADDPFQIEFSIGGPKRNLADLGYGISQVIPIVYLASSVQEDSILMIQQPEVHLHPKAQASLSSFLLNKYKKNNIKFIIETHSDFILDRVRYNIMKNNISQKDVSILFFRAVGLENKIIEIKLDEMGQPAKPPKIYREFFEKEQLKILGIEE